jgi:hypothetical protein
MNKKTMIKKTSRKGTKTQRRKEAKKGGSK